MYATDEYDAEDNLVYCPPPLDEVWLDDESCRQSRDELRRQCSCNDAQVRSQDRAARERASAPTTKAGPTPAAAIPRGDGAVISDSEDDSSVESGSSESEGGVGNNNAYDKNDDGSLPPPVNVPEGAPPAAPSIEAGPCWSGCQRKPREKLIESCNIRAVEALSSSFEFRTSCPNYV